MFSKLLTLIRTVIHKLIPYKTIESVEQIESPLSSEMACFLLFIVEIKEKTRIKLRVLTFPSGGELGI